jgi:hypothetical protein
VTDTEKVQRRLFDYVAEYCKQVRWVDKARETAWLEKGMFELGLDPYVSRSMVLCGVTSRSAWLQSEVERTLDVLLLECAGRSRTLHREAFRRCTGFVQRLGAGGLTRVDAEDLVKQSMARGGIRPRRSGLFLSRRWHRVAGTGHG